jgi:hypothetical protein
MRWPSTFLKAKWAKLSRCSAKAIFCHSYSSASLPHPLQLKTLVDLCRPIILHFGKQLPNLSGIAITKCETLSPLLGILSVSLLATWLSYRSSYRARSSAMAARSILPLPSWWFLCIRQWTYDTAPLLSVSVLIYAPRAPWIWIRFHVDLGQMFLLVAILSFDFGPGESCVELSADDEDLATSDECIRLRRWGRWLDRR